MKKILFFLAALVGMTLAGCIDEKFVGDLPPSNTPVENEEAILFGFDMQKVTRGDIYGDAAATLLGNNFYVMGTKGTEADDSPTPTKVFDNYLVHYTANTAGTTTSNTANWEYVGVTPGTAPTADYIKLGSYLTGADHAGQTIKYWDYSTAQYDFFAFSTGEYKPVLYESSVVSTEDPKTIGVTAMAYGTSLKNSGTAYTFDLPSVNALKNAYITDITEVTKTNYNKEVQLQFKNLGSKVRLALYETVPGYSVLASSVKFYQVDNDAVKSGQTDYEAPTTAAALISESTSSFASKGVMTVFFPNVGNDNSGNNNYNKAATNVTAGAGDTKMTFGTLASDKYAAAEFDEASGGYLGRTLPTATFAGDKDAAYYETVFPVSTSYPLTLRVDYTLVATDGSGETINIYGAKAVVPATYTKWQPNYAYTYIFKISDNTNGWTDQDKTNPGLFPITFDAVVTEATDVSGEQTTITTVATPTITTYQQGHNTKTDGSFDVDVPDEYDNDVEKNVYAQVMDNSSTPAKPVGATGCSLPDLTDANSLLFAVTGTDITEAKVMDALENNIDGFGTYPIEGRNNITLAKNDNITNGVVEIENGVDDNKITLTKATQGHVAAINTHALAAGTYAYVYNYQAKTDANDKNVYQLIVKTAGVAIGVTDKTRYCSITTEKLTTWDDESTASHYSTAGAPAADCLYFSVTKNGTDTKTYSFVSVDGKATIPAGLLKVPVQTDPMTLNVNGSTEAVAGTFYFDKYINNDGAYAVKVIKVAE